MKRTLRLRRETLGSLSDDDLGGVVGANATREGGGLTCGALVDCVLSLLPTCGCVVGTVPCLHTRIPTCNCNTPPNC